MSALQLALKIDVDTLRGTREGVPALVDALKRAEADATFLFSLGPDHTGRALRRVFRRGMFDFARKVSRTSVLEHYGLRTLLYGTLLPGPDIGRRAGDVMRRRARRRLRGRRALLRSHHLAGLRQPARRRLDARSDAACGATAFAKCSASTPQVHGAAGWQMNEAALELEEELGFLYASDTRGETPFVPLLSPPSPQPQRRSACPQLPTTLPTLDELIGVDGITVDNVHQALLERTRDLRASHVFTLHAELEGMKLLPVFRRLIQGWHGQGYQLVSMRTLLARTGRRQPACRRACTSGSVPGRSGALAVQGPARASSIISVSRIARG